MDQLKLYMLLLGCKPPGRHVEQHDFFFGIAGSLKELIPHINDFWPEASYRIHIDAWREVTIVDGYRVEILQRSANNNTSFSEEKLFFINLGGYQPDRFEEQHYVLLNVKHNKAAAIKEAKATLFYQHNQFDKAISHVDDQYGIDVDDLYQIDDMMLPAQKEMYSINLIPTDNTEQDKLNLGYLKLSAL